MSGWRQWRDPEDREHFEIVLTDRDYREMEREQVEMLNDALWLVRAALAGHVEGPLTLPLTGMPVR